MKPAELARRRERLLDALADTLVRLRLARAGVDFRRQGEGEVAFVQRGHVRASNREKPT